MTVPTSSADEILGLRNEIRRLRLGMLLLIGLGLIFALTAFADTAPDVLRVKGLVVVDDKGRERIVLGAPTPQVKNRNRKDARTVSMVFLGENGADRLVIGESPDPAIGGKVLKRSEDGFGMLLHDSNGHERGGMGMIGDQKAVVALDRPNGDAVSMIVDDKADFAGLVVNYAGQVGQYSQGAALATARDETFLLLDDHGQARRVVMKVKGNGDPVLQLFDRENKLQKDLFATP